jgi:hypothetical protein
MDIHPRTALRAGVAFSVLLASFVLPRALPAAQPQPGTGKPAPLELKEPASARPWHRYRVDSQGSSWPQTDWSDYSDVAHLDRTPP